MPIVQVFSRTARGFVYALSPTPELWSQVVPNRTQIVQVSDKVLSKHLKMGRHEVQYAKHVRSYHGKNLDQTVAELTTECSTLILSSRGLAER